MTVNRNGFLFDGKHFVFLGVRLPLWTERGCLMLIISLQKESKVADMCWEHLFPYRRTDYE